MALNYHHEADAILAQLKTSKANRHKANRHKGDVIMSQPDRTFRQAREALLERLRELQEKQRAILADPTATNPMWKEWQELNADITACVGDLFHLNNCEHAATRAELKRHKPAT